MNKKAEFPFAQARRISPSEVIAAAQAIEEQFGINYTRLALIFDAQAHSFCKLR